MDRSMSLALPTTRYRSPVVTVISVMSGMFSRVGRATFKSRGRNRLAAYRPLRRAAPTRLDAVGARAGLPERPTPPSRGSSMALQAPSPRAGFLADVGNPFLFTAPAPRKRGNEDAMGKGEKQRRATLCGARASRARIAGNPADD
jgi:hypothetical protein